MRRVLLSAVVGFGAAILVGVVAFALARCFDKADPVGFFIAPAFILFPPTGVFGLDEIVRWVVPEGGPPAGILSILFCALFFWTLVFSAVHFGCTVLIRHTR
jgi:hypothetical protein